LDELLNQLNINMRRPKRPWKSTDGGDEKKPSDDAAGGSAGDEKKPSDDAAGEAAGGEKSDKNIILDFKAPPVRQAYVHSLTLELISGQAKRLLSNPRYRMNLAHEELSPRKDPRLFFVQGMSLIQKRFDKAIQKRKDAAKQKAQEAEKKAEVEARKKDVGDDLGPSGGFDVATFKKNHRRDTWVVVKDQIEWKMVLEAPDRSYFPNREFWTRIKSMFDGRIRHFFAKHAGIHLTENGLGKFEWKNYVRDVINYVRKNDPGLLSSTDVKAEMQDLKEFDIDTTKTSDLTRPVLLSIHRNIDRYFDGLVVPQDLKKLLDSVHDSSKNTLEHAYEAFVICFYYDSHILCRMIASVIAKLIDKSRYRPNPKRNALDFYAYKNDFEQMYEFLQNHQDNVGKRAPPFYNEYSEGKKPATIAQRRFEAHVVYRYEETREEMIGLDHRPLIRGGPSLLDKRWKYRGVTMLPFHQMSIFHQRAQFVSIRNMMLPKWSGPFDRLNQVDVFENVPEMVCSFLNRRAQFPQLTRGLLLQNGKYIVGLRRAHRDRIALVLVNRATFQIIDVIKNTTLPASPSVIATSPDKTSFAAVFNYHHRLDQKRIQTYSVDEYKPTVKSSEERSGFPKYDVNEEVEIQFEEKLPVTHFQYCTNNIFMVATSETVSMYRPDAEETNLLRTPDKNSTPYKVLELSKLKNLCVSQLGKERERKGRYEMLPAIECSPNGRYVAVSYRSSFTYRLCLFVWDTKKDKVFQITGEDRLGVTAATIELKMAEENETKKTSNVTNLQTEIGTATTNAISNHYRKITDPLEKEAIETIVQHRYKERIQKANAEQKEAIAAVEKAQASLSEANVRRSNGINDIVDQTEDCVLGQRLSCYPRQTFRVYSKVALSFDSTNTVLAVSTRQSKVLNGIYRLENENQNEWTKRLNFDGECKDMVFRSGKLYCHRRAPGCSPDGVGPWLEIVQINQDQIVPVLQHALPYTERKHHELSSNSHQRDDTPWWVPENIYRSPIADAQMDISADGNYVSFSSFMMLRHHLADRVGEEVKVLRISGLPRIEDSAETDSSAS